MARHTCSVDITIHLVPFEPDGSACHACGDVIYLPGKKAIFVHKGKKIGDSAYGFCQSCGEELEAMLNGKEEEGEWWKDDNE